MDLVELKGNLKPWNEEIYHRVNKIILQSLLKSQNVYFFRLKHDVGFPFTEAAI